MPPKPTKSLTELSAKRVAKNIIADSINESRDAVTKKHTKDYWSVPKKAKEKVKEMGEVGESAVEPVLEKKLFKLNQRRNIEMKRDKNPVRGSRKTLSITAKKYGKK